MVHTFVYRHNGAPFYFLWDIESGSLFNVDDVAFLCAKNRYKKEMSAEETAAFASLEPTKVAEANEELAEMEADGALNTPPMVESFKKNASTLKAMCLHICHDCNLRCEYCFASGGTYNTARDYMTLDIGKRAIDLLIANSGIKRNLEVDFFGGEPLMNMDVVKGIVEYAKARGAECGKYFSFTMTTNCLMLDKANIDYLNAEMDNVVLSIDGRANVHNAVRHACNGKDVYDIILKNALAFRKVRGNKKYYVRGTFTSQNLDFASDVLALNDMGFDQISVEPVVLNPEHKLAITEEAIPKILEEYDRLTESYIERRKGEKWFNFFHFMIDLKHGPCINKRLTGCGAGTEYLAVSPTGELYPCHQFVGGDKSFLVGDVYSGITHQEVRERFAEITVLKKEHCKSCPAKYYCGGGCAANAKNFGGGLDGQYKLGCELTKKRLEDSLAIAFIESNRNS